MRDMLGGGAAIRDGAAPLALLRGDLRRCIARADALRLGVVAQYLQSVLGELEEMPG